MRAAIPLCVVLNVMDGYDILVMAFGAPAIKMAWGLSTADVGVIFAVGLAGMGLGGISLAPMADLLGRRRIILICLTLTTAGMLACAFSQGPAQLMTARFITGLGVGGMMPTLNTIIAEYVPGKRRNVTIVIQATGYPIGGMLGGLLALQLLDSHGWQSLFLVGGTVSALLLPAALRWIPESPEYLAKRGSFARGAAGRIGPRALFSGGLMWTTLAISAAVFCVQFTFYFVVNWAPTLLGRGTAASIGMSAAVLLNVGGIIGDVLFGLLCLRASPRTAGAVAMAGCFLSIALLSQFPPAEWSSWLMAVLIGGFLYASMASLYAIAPAVFPALARSSGTGVALSVGRVGGIFGPWVGALRLDSPVLLAAPLLLAAMLILFSIGDVDHDQ